MVGTKRRREEDSLPSRVVGHNNKRDEKATRRQGRSKEGGLTDQKSREEVTPSQTLGEDVTKKTKETNEVTVRGRESSPQDRTGNCGTKSATPSNNRFTECETAPTYKKASTQLLSTSPVDSPNKDGQDLPLQKPSTVSADLNQSSQIGDEDKIITKCRSPDQQQKTSTLGPSKSEDH